MPENLHKSDAQWKRIQERVKNSPNSVRRSRLNHKVSKRITIADSPAIADHYADWIEYQRQIGA